MQTDRDEMTYETPYQNGINRTLQPRPPQHPMSFDSPNTLATGVQDCFNRHVDSNNIYSEISQPMHGKVSSNSARGSSNANSSQDTIHIPKSHLIQMMHHRSLVVTLPLLGLSSRMTKLQFINRRTTTHALKATRRWKMAPCINLGQCMQLPD